MNRHNGFHKLLSLCLAVALAASFAIVPAHAATFSDVKSSSWAAEAINAGVSRGYISGYPDNTFKPNSSVTRAEFSKMLNQAIGMTNTTTVAFSDVSSTAWYYAEVGKALSAQYISGYTDGTFGPTRTITRQEAALMLSRIVTAPTKTASISSFADASSIASWATDGVAMIYAKSYMNGDNKNKFNPTGNLTRAEAAQIIFNVLKGETVITDSNAQITSTADKSGLLYANNVTVTAAADTGAISFQNCRILGTLAVNGGASVTMANTDTNALASSAADVLLRATGSTTVKTAAISNGATLSESALTGGKGFQNVTLAGTLLPNSTVKLSGTFDTIDVQNSTVISHSGGTIADLNLSKKSNVVFQNGTMTALTVDKAAAGSTISLASGVTVGKATLNGATTFYGTGTITNAVENVNGVTYETQPGTITNNAAANTDGILQPTVVPANGTAGVDTDSTISLVFDENIYNTTGASVSAAYVRDSVVTLRKDSSSGTVIACSAVVNGKTITLYPSASLSENTTYYVTVAAGTLQNTAGKTNSKYTSYFSTKSATTSASLTPTVSPTNGTSGVTISSDITLTFNSVLFNASGNTLTASYVEGNVVELRQGSTSGTLVSYTATLSSDKKSITLSPDDDLNTNTTYYVIVKSGKLKNSTGSTNPALTTSFSTGTSTTLTPTVTPSNGQINVSKTAAIQLNFGEAIYESLGVTLTPSYVKSNVVELHKGSVGGESIAYTATITNKQLLTITPTVALADNTTYYVVVNKGSVVNAGGSSNSRFISYFATGSTITSDISVSPADKATGVSASGAIKVSFPNTVYRTGYTSLKTSYVESTAIELRQGSVGGPKIDCTASISADGKTITLQPDSDLSMNTRYYINVVANTLDYPDGTRVNSFSSYFTTEDSNPVTITIDTANDVTSTGATFTVNSAVVGKLTVTYYGGGKNVTLVSGLTTKANESREFELSDLSAGNGYNITATLVYNGLTYTRTQSFNTSSTSVTASLKEMRLITSGDEYSIIDSANASTYQTVTPTTATNAKLTMLPTESSVSAVEYRFSTDSAAYTPMSKDSNGYYSITGLNFAKGDKLVLYIRVIAENTNYNRVYTVNINCNY